MNDVAAHLQKDKYAFGYDDFVVGPAILIKKDALKNLGVITLTLAPTRLGVPNQIQKSKKNFTYPPFL